MKLSERLLDEAEGYGPGPTTFQADEVRQLAALLREAAALAKSVESAPVVTTEQVGPTMAYVYFEDPPGPLKRECALVPLTQQSET